MVKLADPVARKVETKITLIPSSSHALFNKFLRFYIIFYWKMFPTKNCCRSAAISLNIVVLDVKKRKLMYLGNNHANLHGYPIKLLYFCNIPVGLPSVLYH